MNAEQPFVVVITAPATGVGKSTLASNLAIYLKGLDEDLPVAYLPLDDSARPDKMFALGRSAGCSLADFNQAASVAELLCFGQFGVEYTAALPAGTASIAPQGLRDFFSCSAYPGVLLLDVGLRSPYWQAALWAADLVLVPVKDPASLAQLTALRRELKAGGGVERQLWLLPSQLGGLSQASAHLELEEFLRFAADERGFQVLNGSLPDETSVRDCAQGGAVLTRARRSRTHQQLRQLAELLLAERQSLAHLSVRLQRLISDGRLPARARRIEFCCPLCNQTVWAQSAHYLEAYPSRRRLLVHQDCLALLLVGTSAAAFQDGLGLMLLQPAVAAGGTAEQLRLQVIDSSGEPLETELLHPTAGSNWPALLSAVTGRQLAELYAEVILISAPQLAQELLTDGFSATFQQRRIQLRELCRAEKL